MILLNQNGRKLYIYKNTTGKYTQNSSAITKRSEMEGCKKMNFLMIRKKYIIILLLAQTYLFCFKITLLRSHDGQFCFHRGGNVQILVRKQQIPKFDYDATPSKLQPKGKISSS